MLDTSSSRGGALQGTLLRGNIRWREAIWLNRPNRIFAEGRPG